MPPGADPVLFYAIVPRCPIPGMTALAATTWKRSHEIVEAATDPRDDLPAPGTLAEPSSSADCHTTSFVSVMIQ